MTLKETLLALKEAIQEKDEYKMRKLLSVLRRAGMDDATVRVLLENEEEWNVDD